MTASRAGSIPVLIITNKGDKGPGSRRMMPQRCQGGWTRAPREEILYLETRGETGGGEPAASRRRRRVQVSNRKRSIASRSGCPNSAAIISRRCEFPPQGGTGAGLDPGSERSPNWLKLRWGNPFPGLIGDANASRGRRLPVIVGREPQRYFRSLSRSPCRLASGRGKTMCPGEKVARICLRAQRCQYSPSPYCHGTPRCCGEENKGEARPPKVGVHKRDWSLAVSI